MSYDDFTATLVSENDRLKAEVERLRAALTGATASLAAATSLLERGGEKAAPSGTMFLIMLADYHNSLAQARAALTQQEGDK